MNTALIKKVEAKYVNAGLPKVRIGDNVVVDTVIRDGDKKRIQKFKGLVIAVKGKGGSKTFTVRKISYGVGVEKTFPFNSVNVAKIEVLKHAKVRRSKLYYLRERIGKAAMKLKGSNAIFEEDNAPEPEASETNESSEQPETVASEEVKAEEAVPVEAKEAAESETVSNS